MTMKYESMTINELFQFVTKAAIKSNINTYEEFHLYFEKTTYPT